MVVKHADATDPARLIGAVARCRRRAASVAAARIASMSAALALLVVEVLAFAGWWPISPLATIGGIAFTAIAIAAAGGVMMTPSLRTIAAIVDTRLHLHNRLATAMQFAADNDAVALLVVRDGIAAARHVDPAAAFPLSFPQALKPLAVVVVAMPLLVVAGRGITSALGGGSADSSAGVAGAVGAPAARAPQSVRTPRSATAPSAPADDRPAAQSRAAALPAQSNTSANDPDAPETTSAPSSTTAGDGRIAAGQAVGDSAGRGAGGGAVGTGDGRRLLMAGGVSGGDLSATRPRAANSAGTGDVVAGVRGVGPESAISQDRVPVRHRAYIRRYFTALTAGTGR